MNATPVPKVLIRPAWREPMVWLVVGLPAAVVLACAVTMWIAYHAPDGGGSDIPRMHKGPAIEMSAP